MRGWPARALRRHETLGWGGASLAGRVDLDAEAGALGAGDGRDRPARAPPRSRRGRCRRRRRRRPRCRRSPAARRRARRCRRPEIAASAANGGRPSSRRRARSGSTSRPGSASSAARTTSWCGQERLHEQPATVAASPGETGAAHEQRHRLLGGPVARRQQLGVDVEEGDDVGPRHPVQHGLGADVDPGGRRQLGVGTGDGDHRTPRRRLQLLAQPGHAGPQVGERRRPALQAHGGADRAAAAAGERLVVGHPDRRVAHRAARQRPAAPAGEDPRPPRRVVDAHDDLAPRRAGA